MINNFLNKYTGTWSIQQTINHLTQKEIKKNNYKVTFNHKNIDDNHIFVISNNKQITYKLNYALDNINTSVVLGKIFTKNKQIGICKIDTEKDLKIYKRIKGLDIEETLKLLSDGLYISHATVKINGNLIATCFKSAIKIVN
jgi:hypothetical protein